jgi:crotonobetainyl-CoA:carnitine CoA-transferase CaiB-like acyl-CoA transferase
MNYQAQTGMVGLSGDANGAPSVPPVLTADLAGGAYPAVMNILLGLRRRDREGVGCHLDISMADNLFPLMYWGLGDGWAAGQWPRAGNELVTGGSPRYQIYQTADNKFLTAAPLEDKFWGNFLTVLGATELQHLDNPELVKASIAKIIAQQPVAYWNARFAGQDTCVCEVIGLEQAVQDPHFQERGVFSRSIATASGKTIPALPTPISGVFLHSQQKQSSPDLGQHTQEILK